MIHSTAPIKKDLVAIRSLFILSSWYFSLPTRNVAMRYPSIKPQNTRYHGIIMDFINSKFDSENNTSHLI